MEYSPSRFSFKGTVIVKRIIVRNFYYRSAKLLSPISNQEGEFHTVRLSCSCFLESLSSVCFTRWILLEPILLTAFVYVIHNLRVSTASHESLCLYSLEIQKIWFRLYLNQAKQLLCQNLLSLSVVLLVNKHHLQYVSKLTHCQAT